MKREGDGDFEAYSAKARDIGVVEEEGEGVRG